jgi:hypothetical protein
MFLETNKWDISTWVNDHDQTEVVGKLWPVDFFNSCPYFGKSFESCLEFMQLLIIDYLDVHLI